MKQVFHKSRIYPLLLAIAVFAVFKYREGNTLKKVEFQGTTMGTTYAIKYLDKRGTDYKPQIDSLLQVFNMSMSTYIPESEISRFNTNAELQYELPYFWPVLQRSKEIHKITGGAFDPTIGPLVNAWGFGPSSDRVPDSSKIADLLQLVNFDSIYFDVHKVKKLKKGMMLDFSAIAKGYGVDIVADFLSSKNINDLMVEIGGEVVCKGVNDKGKAWSIGIDKPDLNQGLQAIVQLENKAIATSGNYRNFYEKDGKKYAHTIDPVSGYPVQHSLLSASVFSKDCMTADAFATAFMVLGLEKSKEILNTNKELDAFLIYADEDGKYRTFTTEGINPFIRE